jgi:hypothetical protein
MASTVITTTTEAKILFEGLVYRCVKHLGFTRRSSLVFVRPSKEYEAFLLFGVRKDTRGYYAATGSVALHIKLLEPLIEVTTPNRIHLNIPFHLLGTEQPFREWHFSDKTQVDALVSDVSEVISNRVIPWLTEFENLRTLSTRLSSSNPKDWFALSPEQRIVLLAGLRWVLGDESLARSTIRESLSKLEKAMPSKRTPLERLQEKMNSHDNQ